MYWLISAPDDAHLFDTLHAKTAKETYSMNFRFAIPELRVGTLDSLMALSDDLLKVDTFVESVVHKIGREYSALSEGNEPPGINGAPVDSYLTRFQWDEAKYPISSPLSELVDMIQEQLNGQEEELRVKSTDYQAVKTSLASLDRRTTGNLSVRALDGIVSEEDCIDSENLCTVFVVIPKYMYADWDSKYENLSEMVVPRSSKLIKEDNEYGLFRVVLFKRVVDEFKAKCREQRFTVRDYEYDPEALEQSQSERSRLEGSKEDQWRTLFRWCKTSYSEAFIAWIHLKAIRVFVESVLRYGLPPRFRALLMKPQKKHERRVRDALNSVFGHLGGGNFTADKADPVEALAGEFYPYVYFTINA